MNRKLLAWALYDFAGYIISANILLYFAQWVVVENHIPDIWYAAVTALSTILLFLVGPILGTYVDQSGRRMALIVPLTVVVGLTTMGIGFFGLGPLSLSIKLAILLSLAFVIQFAYQLILIFYDTMIPFLSNKSRYGQTSGLGDGIGTLGFLGGLLITYPFVNGLITAPGRLQAFIPAGFAFLLLSAPLLFLFKDVARKNIRPKIKISNVLHSLHTLLKDQGLSSFLVAFYFISDGILTVQTFFAIFFQQALGFADKEKILAIAVVLIFSAPGAAIIGKFSDQLGPKRLLIWTTLLLIILLCLIPLLPAGPWIWIIFAFFGFFWGGFYSVARAFLTHLSPSNQRSEVFSLYTIFRRFASVVGPMLWGITLLSLGGLELAVRYKLAIYPQAVLMILGLFLLRKIPDIRIKPSS